MDKSDFDRPETWKGWRQWGCVVQEALDSSNMDYYYKVLEQTIARCLEDMNVIRPNVPETLCDVSAPAQIPEKVADLTHKGPGF